MENLNVNGVPGVKKVNSNRNRCALIEGGS